MRNGLENVLIHQSLTPTTWNVSSRFSNSVWLLPVRPRQRCNREWIVDCAPCSVTHALKENWAGGDVPHIQLTPLQPPDFRSDYIPLLITTHGWAIVLGSETRVQRSGTVRSRNNVSRRTADSGILLSTGSNRFHLCKRGDSEQEMRSYDRDPCACISPLTPLSSQHHHLPILLSIVWRVEVDQLWSVCLRELGLWEVRRDSVCRSKPGCFTRRA